MTIDELKNWIIDTISEGGYSFKELYEYILRHSVTEDDFLEVISYLNIHGNIIVYVSSPKSEQKIFLDDWNSKATIENYMSVVDLESKIGSRHFVELNGKGRSR